ncbi:MAG: site-2 protease family protein [Verrucomicrobiia bacterium]|jgi:tetratricopeptide (TPR) repeat protein
MSTQCTKCGVTSELDEAFVAGNQFGHPYCPACILKDHGDDFRALKWMVPGVFIFGVIAINLSPQDDTGWACLNALIFFAFSYVSLIIHEAGHGLMGKALGLRVTHVQLGLGRTIVLVKWLDVRWEFKVIPFGGFAIYVPEDHQWFRTRSFLTTLAGPLANLIVAGVMWWFIRQEAAFTNPVLGDLYFWHLLLGANLFDGIWNLVPSNGQKTPSDGMQLLAIPKYSEEAIRGLKGNRWRAECELSLEEGDFADALKQADAALQHLPNDPDLRSHRVRALLGLHDFSTAQTEALELYEVKQLSTTGRATVANAIARANLMLDDPRLLQEADFHTRQTMRILPWEAEFKATRGHVLIQLGDHDEGVELLRSALADTSEPTALAEIHCQLALGEFLRDNPNVASEELSSARRIDPKCFLISRVEAQQNAPASAPSP